MNEAAYKVLIFNGKKCLGMMALRDLPRTGDYIQLGGQAYRAYVAYRIEAVVFLQSNPWFCEMMIVVENVPLKIPAREVYEAEQEERRDSNGEIGRDRETYRNPNEHWLRRKLIYDRIEAGESVDVIAADEGVSVTRVKQLASEWRHLLVRIDLYENRDTWGEPWRGFKEEAALATWAQTKEE